MSKSRRTRIGHSVLHVFLIFGAIVVAIPLLWMISTSLKPLDEVFSFEIKWFPSEPTWENYQQVWTLLPFGRYFLNSILVSVVVTLGALLISSCAGFAFARLQFPFRDQLFLLYLGAMMIPIEITVVPNFILMRYLGWIDSYQGIIAPQLFNVFGTFLMRQFFMSLPKDLENAAKIDGAGYFKIFFTIALPLTKPALSALGIFAFMGSWNNFLWPLIITNSEELRTIPVALLSFQGEFTTHWPILMAAAGSALIPVLMVYFIAQKQFIRGITMSGMAGQ